MPERKKKPSEQTASRHAGMDAITRRKLMTETIRELRTQEAASQKEEFGEKRAASEAPHPNRSASEKTRRRNKTREPNLVQDGSEKLKNIRARILGETPLPNLSDLGRDDALAALEPIMRRIAKSFQYREIEYNDKSDTALLAALEMLENGERDAQKIVDEMIRQVKGLARLLSTNNSVKFDDKTYLPPEERPFAHKKHTSSKYDDDGESRQQNVGLLRFGGLSASENGVIKPIKIEHPTRENETKKEETKRLHLIADALGKADENSLRICYDSTVNAVWLWSMAPGADDHKFLEVRFDRQNQSVTINDRAAERLSLAGKLPDFDAFSLNRFATFSGLAGIASLVTPLELREILFGPIKFSKQAAIGSRSGRHAKYLAEDHTPEQKLVQAARFVAAHVKKAGLSNPQVVFDPKTSSLYVRGKAHNTHGICLVEFNNAQNVKLHGSAQIPQLAADLVFADWNKPNMAKQVAAYLGANGRLHGLTQEAAESILIQHNDGKTHSIYSKEQCQQFADLRGKYPALKLRVLIKLAVKRGIFQNSITFLTAKKILEQYPVRLPRKHEGVPSLSGERFQRLATFVREHKESAHFSLAKQAKEMGILPPNTAINTACRIIKRIIEDPSWVYVPPISKAQKTAFASFVKKLKWSSGAKAPRKHEGIPQLVGENFQRLASLVAENADVAPGTLVAIAKERRLIPKEASDRTATRIIANIRRDPSGVYLPKVSASGKRRYKLTLEQIISKAVKAGILPRPIDRHDASLIMESMTGKTAVHFIGTPRIDKDQIAQIVSLDKKNPGISLSQLIDLAIKEKILKKKITVSAMSQLLTRETDTHRLRVLPPHARALSPNQESEFAKLAIENPGMSVRKLIPLAFKNNVTPKAIDLTLALRILSDAGIRSRYSKLSGAEISGFVELAKNYPGRSLKDLIALALEQRILPRRIDATTAHYLFKRKRVEQQSSQLHAPTQENEATASEQKESLPEPPAKWATQFPIPCDEPKSLDTLNIAGKKPIGELLQFEKPELREMRIGRLAAAVAGGQEKPLIELRNLLEPRIQKEILEASGKTPASGSELAFEQSEFFNHALKLACKKYDGQMPFEQYAKKYLHDEFLKWEKERIRAKNKTDRTLLSYNGHR